MASYLPHYTKKTLKLNRCVAKLFRSIEKEDPFETQLRLAEEVRLASIRYWRAEVQYWRPGVTLRCGNGKATMAALEQVTPEQVLQGVTHKICAMDASHLLERATPRRLARKILEAIVTSSFAPVPQEFHSFETGKPFERCIDCEKHLVVDSTGYFVQKAIRGTEVIFEFAQCVECHEKLFESLSRETRNRVYDFFLDRVNFDQRRKKLLQEAWTSLGPWIESCLFCGAARSATREYWLVGECHGRDMMFYNYPYIICEACMFEKNKLLSAKSRGASDDWIGRRFDTPPSIAQGIPDATTALV